MRPLDFSSSSWLFCPTLSALNATTHYTNGTPRERVGDSLGPSIVRAAKCELTIYRDCP